QPNQVLDPGTPRQAFLGQDQAVRARHDLAGQLLQGFARRGRQARFLEEAGRDFRVFSRRDEQQNPRAAGVRRGHVCGAGGEAGIGTPVNTPCKSAKGSLTVMPLLLNWSSRMVSSCRPLRFFTTEIAFFTRPAVSK